MSFSARVKEELSHQLSKARHCQIAELAAILSLCGKIHIDEEDHFSIRIHTENVAVARKYFTLLKNTFNIKAALEGSDHRAFVDRSHDFASTDVSTNFGHKYGLKFYGDGQASAKAQSISVFQRFKEYQNSGGKDGI